MSSNTFSPAFLQVFPNPFTGFLKLRNIGNEEIRNIEIGIVNNKKKNTNGNIHRTPTASCSAVALVMIGSVGASGI